MASEELRLIGLSEWVRGVFHVDSLTGDCITAGIVFLIFLIPLIWLKAHSITLITTSLFILSALTAIGWLPWYSWVLIGIYVSIGVSNKMKGWF